MSDINRVKNLYNGFGDDTPPRFLFVIILIVPNNLSSLVSLDSITLLVYLQGGERTPSRELVGNFSLL